MQVNSFKKIDCIVGMPELPTNSIDLTLTDIPYDGVNRESGGIRNLDKSKADIITFNLSDFLKEVDRVTKGTIVIFCGFNQLSEIYNYFNAKDGTVRVLVWEKANPSPINGQYVYLSGVETAVWFRKSGANFNAKCKNTVFKYPVGTSNLHPTEKNWELLREIITDNTNPGDLVFDPCSGSGSTLYAAKMTGRNYIGFELDQDYYEKANNRLTGGLW